MYLALTGARLKGEDVVKAGIATHFVPSEKLAALEADLATQASSDVGELSLLIESHDERTDNEASFAPHMDEINACFSGDSVDDIIGRLEASGSEWAVKQRDTIMRMSPTSLKITHEQFKRGQSLSLDECFTMEYRMTQACMRNKDFFEGIRAQLIDKDRSPIWDPAMLDDVSVDLVESYFQPVENDLHLVKNDPHLA